MKQAEVSKYLEVNFYSVLRKFGFKKNKYRFVKSISELYIRFLFAVVNNDNSFPCHFSYGIGSSKLRTLLKKVLPEKFVDIPENDYFTAVGTGQFNLFDNGKYPTLEYDIYTEADAQKMVDEVSTYILNEVLPEWEANPTLEYLEKKVNKKLTDVPNFSGLILAKLVGNPKYESIKQHSTNLSQDWNDWNKKDLEKVIEFLDAHTREELLQIAETPI